MEQKQQVATYAIKVDLDCEKCRNKIKKVLCEIPQIQDQLYDEKNNVVVVKVVCCNPDKVKKKICCKGGKTVKGVELLKPPPPPKPKEKEAAPPPPPKPEEKPKDPPPPPPKDKTPPNPTPAPPPPKVLEPAPVLVPAACCRECYEGREGGPCWTIYGRPCIGNESNYVYGRPVYDSWGGGSYVGCQQGTTYYRRGGSRCTDYISDDNSAGCFIM